jgi:CheY-like chemotaxis protein
MSTDWIIIGDATSTEFAPLGDDAQRLQAATFASISAAIDTADRLEIPPTWVVLVEGLPGIVDRCELNRLVSCWPLARIVRVVGSWTESEQRHRQPLPGCQRIAWHRWSTWLAETLAAEAQGQLVPWLPLATDDDRWLLPSSSQQVLPTGSALLVGDDWGQLAWIADFCRQRGSSVVWRRCGAVDDLESCHAVVYDIAFPNEKTEVELAGLRARFPRAPLVVLAGFPRANDRQRWLAAGATAVLAKPVLLGDLHAALN